MCSREWLTPSCLCPHHHPTTSTHDREYSGSSMRCTEYFVGRGGWWQHGRVPVQDSPVAPWCKPAARGSGTVNVNGKTKCEIFVEVGISLNSLTTRPCTSFYISNIQWLAIETHHGARGVFGRREKRVVHVSQIIDFPPSSTTAREGNAVNVDSQRICHRQKVFETLHGVVGAFGVEFLSANVYFVVAHHLACESRMIMDWCRYAYTN